MHINYVCWISEYVLRELAIVGYYRQIFKTFNQVVWIVQVRFAKRYWMNDDLWERWRFMSPGESVGALMFPSFLLQMRKFLYIHICFSILNVNLRVSFFDRLNLCNLSLFQKTIMAVNIRGSNLARPKQFRWSFYSDFYGPTTDW